MDAAALDRVYEAFQDFHDYCAPVFGRKQWRERSGQYLQALLVQSHERRNAENLSETVTASPRVLQRFLTEAAAIISRTRAARSLGGSAFQLLLRRFPNALDSQGWLATLSC